MYDKNGNIKSLKRTGAFDDAIATLEIDDLTYTYDPAKVNQLTNISDGSNSSEGFINDSASTTIYTFDENGNMKSDLSKNITDIKYNHLNLPTKITFSNGGSIDYIYNAYGSQIKQSISASHIQRSTEYMNGFQYSNGILNFFSTSEGYVQNTVSNGLNNFNYVYNYTDHLGNIRLSYGEDPLTHTVKILKENNYYPFGLKHKNYNMSEKNYSKTHGGIGIISCPTCPKTYQYQYNGKEYQSDLGLNVTQMDFRQYDNATGRFNTVDALSEATYSNSPYHFAGNNPISFSDPTGLISKPTSSPTIPSTFLSLHTGFGDKFGNYDSGAGGDFGGFMSMNGFFQDPTYDGGELDNVFITPGTRPFKWVWGPGDQNYQYSWLYSYIESERGSRRSLGFNQGDTDFAAGVGNGFSTIWSGALTHGNQLKAAKFVGNTGTVITAVNYGHAVLTNQATPAHHFDAATTTTLTVLALNPLTAEVGAPLLLIYGGLRIVFGASFDSYYNSKFSSTNPN